MGGVAAPPTALKANELVQRANPPLTDEFTFLSVKDS